MASAVAHLEMTVFRFLSPFHVPNVCGITIGRVAEISLAGSLTDRIEERQLLHEHISAKKMLGGCSNFTQTLLVVLMLK